MRMSELAVWRDRYKRVKTISEAKSVARDFKKKFNPPIQDHEIFAVLRDHDELFQLIARVIE